MTIRTLTLSSLALATLVGCGSGGGSSDDSDNGGGNQVGNLSISGQIRSAKPFVLDSDVNDVLATYVSNDDPADPQTLSSNLVTIQGFASKAGTNAQASDNANAERFDSEGDENDYYRVFLQKGQLIRLQIADFDENSENSAYSGDLDLALYDASGNLVEVSDGTTNIEEIRVPEDGNYLVNVTAYSGIAKYVLELSVASPSLSSSSQSLAFVPNEAIIQWNSKGKVSAKSTLEIEGYQIPRRSGQTYPTKVNFSQSPSVGARSLSAPSFLKGQEKLKTLRAIKTLSLRDDVTIVEPNYIRQAQATPNDPGYSDQFHYNNIELPKAWDITKGSSDVIVAVVDSGVYVSHPDLEEKLFEGYDFVSDIDNSGDGDGIDSNPDDPGNPDNLGESDFHGTHVAGTVAADTNNGTGVAGAGWDTSIMPLRVLGIDGAGTNADIFEAVRYAAGLSNDSGRLPSKTANIINLSLGGGGRSEIEQDLYNQVRAKGIFIIAAAGNEETDALSFPAAYDGVVSVSASDPQNNLAFYSNFGSTIDVAAPGGEIKLKPNGDPIDGILSTYADTDSGSREPGFALLHGTSMAAPHMSGVVALMLAVYPDLTPSDLDALIQSGTITDDLGAAGRDNEFGYGRINAFKAVTEAKNLADGGALPTSKDPILNSDPQTLYIDAGDSESFTLSNINSNVDDPSVEAQVSDSWITLEEISVDSNNLGEYRVTVSADDYPTGVYVGAIRFTPDSGNPIDITVRMSVGNTDIDPELAPLYVILVNADTDEFVAQSIPDQNGRYRLTGLSSGDYLLSAGSDIDVDNLICQPGESCGAYSNDDPYEVITLTDRNLVSMDFSVDLIEAVEFASKEQKTVRAINKK